MSVPDVFLGLIDGSVPDTVLTPQQWADLYRSSSHTPELRLYFAVLEDAIRTISRHKKEDLRAREALAWINGWPGAITFEDACLTLGINPDWLRPRLIASPETIRIDRRSPVNASTRPTIPYQRLSGCARRTRKIGVR